MVLGVEWSYMELQGGILRPWTRKTWRTYKTPHIMWREAQCRTQLCFFFHILSFKQTSKSNIEIPWNPSHVAREILVLRVFVVATCPIALHHIDALGTARQDWSQEKNLQKLKDTTSRAETRQNWKCTLLVLNDFYQMLAFKISQFSIRNLAIGYYLQ